MSDPPGPILALDLGSRRIGVALSDPEARVASPLCVLPRRGRDHNLRAVRELVQRHGVRQVVVGLPCRRPGELGQAARRAVRFGRRLERFLGIPVHFIDEYETTAEAEEALLEADLSRRRRRQVVDKVAASLILRRFLTRRGEAPA